jgi:vacuolar-type H+-ATPase subunit E/Vma4
MLSFKHYLFEDLGAVKSLSASEKAAFDRAISPFTYEVKNSTSKTTTVVVRAPDEERKQVKSDIENKLTRARLKFQPLKTGGSTGSTSVSFSNHSVLITYKPSSGGMSETTLNSTITELVPALAFMSGKTSASTPKELYNFVKKVKGNPGGVYLDKKDMEAGQKFIENMQSSSKFEEKMLNAIGVLKYLKDLNSKNPISNIYWGYRKKPEGVSGKHKGDLFIKFSNGEMLGVSLKAGGAKTKEPQLNTYVNKFFDDMGFESDKNQLVNKVYNAIHSTLKLPSDWDSRSQKSKSIDKIEQFREKSPKKYEAKYDQMLELIRDSIISAANKDKKTTLEYIRKQILKKDDVVPLVVVKAVNDNFQLVTDEDQLDAFLPLVTKVKAYKSLASKQNWYIELSSRNKTLVMNMSIRSNKPMPENKIAQGYNLAVKFNGISVGK